MNLFKQKEDINNPELFQGVKILVVDDDEMICELVSEFLKSLSADVCYTTESKAAAQWIREREFDIILSDIYMPGMKGQELLSLTLDVCPMTPVIFMTGKPTLDNSIEAIRLGAYDYLIKPFNMDALKVTLKRALDFRYLNVENKAYQEDLEQKVEARTKELSEFLFYSVQSLSLALEARDPYTEGHGQRVANFVLRLADELGGDPKEYQSLRLACQLHDIGKIGIPDSILLKVGSLTEEEYRIMRDHVRIGYKILSPIPSLKVVSRYVYEHHERMDGSGYPRGLKGEEIHPNSRLLMVAEVCDALATERHYKPAWPMADIIDYFEERAGKQFDAAVVEALVRILKREGAMLTKK